jgi:sRNA-binding regulator protein Hfq
LYKNYANNEEAKNTIEQFVLQNINRHLSENGFGVQGCVLQIDNFKISLHNKK